MATQRLSPLSPKDAQALIHAALEHPQPTVRQRAYGILLLTHGHSVVAVAEQLGVARRTVYHWIERFRAHGFDALEDQPRSGRPSQVTGDYRQRMEFLLSRDPHAFRHEVPSYTPQSGWTVRRLSDHLAADTGIQISPGHLRQLLKDWGYVYGAKQVTRVTRHAVPSLLFAPWPSALDALGDLCWQERETVVLTTWTKKPRARPLETESEAANEEINDITTGAEAVAPTEVDNPGQRLTDDPEIRMLLRAVERLVERENQRLSRVLAVQDSRQETRA